MASKKVIIRRREVDLDGLPREIARDAKRPISSIFSNGLPLQGLSDKELHLLEPLINSRVNEAGFRQKVLDYWKDFTIEVPFGGREIEVGTHSDGTPIDARDYIRYKWLLRHKLVGKDVTQPDGTHVSAEMVMRSDPRMTHYLMDPEVEFQRDQARTTHKETAFKAYIEDALDLTKTKMIINYMAPGAEIFTMTPEQLKQMLFKLQESQPAEYVRISTDKNIQLRTELKNMVEFNIITKTGNTYSYVDEPLGSTEDQTIAWMKNTINSRQLLEMRSKLDEALRVRFSADRHELFASPKPEPKPEQKEDEFVTPPGDLPPGTDLEAFYKNEAEQEAKEVKEEPQDKVLVKNTNTRSKK